MLEGCALRCLCVLGSVSMQSNPRSSIALVPRPGTQHHAPLEQRNLCICHPGDILCAGAAKPPSPCSPRCSWLCLISASCGGRCKQWPNKMHSWTKQVQLHNCPSCGGRDTCMVLLKPTPLPCPPQKVVSQALDKQAHANAHHHPPSPSPMGSSCPGGPKAPAHVPEVLRHLYMWQPDKPA